jgi:predicted nucleic acid-binding protein
VRTVDAGELASRLRSLTRGKPRQARWLIVADVNVYIRAITGHPEGPNRKIVEAALAGIITLVISEQIRNETIEVLTREEMGGYDADLAADLMDPICRAARVITPAEDDPKYAKVVRDPDDAIVLRTAAGIYFDDDLARSVRRYIVSGDIHAFPAGRDWYGFKYREAGPFWRELSGTDNGD